jgi:hypothetical protein
MLSLCFAAATLAPAVAMFFLSPGRDGSLPIWTTAVMVTGTSRLTIDRLLRQESSSLGQARRRSSSPRSSSFNSPSLIIHSGTG